MGGELRPPAGDWVGIGDDAPVDQQGEAQRVHRLGGRPDIDHRVGGPGPRPGLVQVASPEIHDRLAIDHDGERGADITPLGEIAFEFRSDIGEGRGGFTVDLDHDPYRNDLEKETPKVRGAP
ncbi:hypothetical protein GALL_507460 [mine drainage metagenome]|uniref:Uncharacterized protein n=1 Tax=mine drainage metagenome TaxID=410659 RepID=A0A1J5P8Z7_9ZZZZ